MSVESRVYRAPGRTPLVLQAEAAECALACLTMIAKAHGGQHELTELRQRFGGSLKGMDLKRLLESAHQLGFAARPLRIELDALKQLPLPCILHWNFNHFVVLDRVRGQRIRVIDPAAGVRDLPLAQASECFTGIAIELWPGPAFQTNISHESAATLPWRAAVRDAAPALLQILLLSMLLQVFVLISPLQLQWLIDRTLTVSDIGLLPVLGVAFLLLLLLQSATTLLRGWALSKTSAVLGLRWSVQVFAHVLRLPLAFFEVRQLGDIVARMASIQAIQRTLTGSFVEACIDGLMALVTLMMMLHLDPRLGVWSVASLVAYATVRIMVFRQMQEQTDSLLSAEAKQRTHLFESLRGAQSIKANGLASLRQTVFENLSVRTSNQDLLLQRLNLGFASFSQLLFGVERILVMLLAASRVQGGDFSLGTLIAYLAYREQFALRASELVDKAVELNMLRLHAARLADIVLASPEPEDASVWPDATLPPSIDVENLCFRYAEGEPWVLQHISFRVAPGECVAIVGPSGCGKSTLIKLLLGLLKPSSGRILIDGQDVHELGAIGARRMMGSVLQDDQLFAGSIAENISLFDTDADFEQVTEAARLAAIHDDILAMPMRYESLIGDMGSTLSGGQKQRIILARALYRKPRLLLLDEATSHLDLARERLVNDAVRQLAVTKIIVAHRPETIASADRALSLNAGTLLPSNQHSECRRSA